MKKYEITEEAHPKYPWLHRIRALQQVREDVPVGTRGGFVASEANLSQDGTCWIYNNAIACEDACVEQHATLRDWAVATDEALISGHASLSQMARAEDCAIVKAGKMCGFSRIAGNGVLRENLEQRTAPQLSENAMVYGIVGGRVAVAGAAVVLPGTVTDNPTVDLITITEKGAAAWHNTKERRIADLREKNGVSMEAKPVEKKSPERKPER